jgi:hypothetical protein
MSHQNQNQPQVVVSLSPNTAIVNYKGKTELFQSDSTEYKSLKDILKKDDSVRNSELVKFVEGYRADKKKGAPPKNVDYRATPEGVYINGDEGEMLLPKVLGDRLLEFVSEGLPTEPIVKFCKRLSLNPSYISVQRLFDCLEHNHHPLLPDGRFLAWKRVKQNGDGKLVDVRTGKFDNSVGQTPRMKRNEVDEDNNVTCSKGLHVSSYDYAMYHYVGQTGVMIEVAVDPADVVAIPKDYNNQKMRVCGYEVLSVCETEDTSNLKNHVGGFAVDPNSENVCDCCGEDVDYCTCDSEEDDLDDTCDNCGEYIDDCHCDDDEELD